MAAKRITYGDINQLLEAEGFQRLVVPDSHVLFENAKLGTSLLLPIQRDASAAAPRHITMVRETLLDFGILSPADFDRWTADPKRYQAA